MEFFVPHLDGRGPMDPDEAEQAWTACRKGAEGDASAVAHDRRVYSLRFNRGGQEVSATVGELDPYGGREPVIAIIAFDGFYKVCCAVRGFLKVGDTPIVGAGAALNAEDFTVV